MSLISLDEYIKTSPYNFTENEIKAIDLEVEKEIQSAIVFDAACYIIDKLGTISAMKLHKLLYYSQAWSLVWDGKPLFKDEIQAWANGPAIPNLYEKHKGNFYVNPDLFRQYSLNALTQEQKETIDAVLEYYGNLSPQELIDLTHSEAPWISARNGLQENEKSRNTINTDSIFKYYNSIDQDLRQ